MLFGSGSFLQCFNSLVEQSKIRMDYSIKMIKCYCIVENNYDHREFD